MPEDFDLEIEVSEWAARRRIPLPPEVLEQRQEDLADLRVRLDRSISEQAQRLAERQL